MLAHQFLRSISLLLCPHFLLLASILFASPAVNAADAPDWIPFDHAQFDNNAALDEKGEVQLFWKVGDVYSTYGIASRSKGYLALGFSETGAMTGADIALGRRDENGHFVLQNRHAGGFSTPRLSKEQGNNIRLKQGNQTDEATWFVFEKKNSADCLEEQANVHTDSWQWFIYAFSSDNTFERHQPGHNGKQYVKLGTGKTTFRNEVLAVPNSKNVTFTQPEITIPKQETTYCYTLHKLPEGKKNFILAEAPGLISSPLVHHIVLYSCYDLPDKVKSMVGQEPNCDYKNFNNPCTSFVAGWAPGMSGRTLEPGYGKPFGADSFEYVMFETHYNNPDALEGEKGSAEFTFTYNDKQVDTEVGTMTLGDLQLSGLTLEPGKKVVSHSTVCSPECTKKWPAEGLTAIAVVHHMHFRGRNTRVQIIRDGMELPPLSTLHDYEYNYQYAKSLNEVQLLPGDRLITTCEFDTSKDTQPVKGGLASKNEMCFAWVEYYPANNILTCTQVNLGKGPNTTVGACFEAGNSTPDLSPPAFLTAPYQQLAAAGNSCDVSTSADSEIASGTGSAAAASTTESGGTATLNPLLSFYPAIFSTSLFVFMAVPEMWVF
ncbi:hypothetical protein LMH87_002636 [Akanthomyces muscarius]|uniref:DOMON domain-containing protein n=1 Tax=Akanthomyces muscarius TaxID=2231603 RepID=A0A9W8Q756_AKAMU|nr:hypothetical protein LMH87_002636 [Akanthomyces muscarius]KAJ4148154.1 hypothetical protein LMH87_002636 [Akanthomyces muscarius]